MKIRRSGTTSRSWSPSPPPSTRAGRTPYLPAYLSTYLPPYLPTCLPTYLPIYLPTRRAGKRSASATHRQRRHRSSRKYPQAPRCTSSYPCCCDWHWHGHCYTYAYLRDMHLQRRSMLLFSPKTPPVGPRRRRGILYIYIYIYICVCYVYIYIYIYIYIERERDAHVYICIHI